MKILNERTLVKDSIKDFVERYGTGTYGADKRGRNIGEELLALDSETVTGSEVNKIIGNGAWVSETKCDECGKQTWDIVEIGEELDYDSSTARVCLDCLKKAVHLIENQKAEELK